MVTKVVTGKVRFSYVHVHEPQEVEGGKPKYSVCILIPKSDKVTVDKIKKAIEAAKIVGKSVLADKSGKMPAHIQSVFHDGDIERPDSPECKGCYYLNANSLNKPGIVDIDRNPILDREEFYSGCYGRASINFYAYNKGMNKGIAAGLNNLQKLADGEPLAGGSTPEEDFGGDNAWDDDDII